MGSKANELRAIIESAFRHEDGDESAIEIADIVMSYVSSYRELFLAALTEIEKEKLQ